MIGALSFGLNETSGRWPGIISLLVLGLCILEIVFSARKQALNRHPIDPTDAPQAGWKTLILTLCAAALASLFGLLAAIVVFVGAHGIWIGQRSPVSAAISAGGAALVLFGFFELGLGVTLYRGVVF